MTEESRLCIACQVRLVGPYGPSTILTHSLSEAPQGAMTVTAEAWICPACGLVHWYTDEAICPSPTHASAEQIPAQRLESGHRRRAQMGHMLRRVRRI